MLQLYGVGKITKMYDVRCH